MDLTQPQPDWDSVRSRISGLWPRYQPTDEERRLIAQRLQQLNMRWLDAAVESYRCACTSTVFRLAELLEHYRRIATTGERAPGRAATEPAAVRMQREREAREREIEQARAWLAQQPRATVAEAVKALRQQGWLKGGQLPGRFSDWPGSTVLMVRAAFPA